MCRVRRGKHHELEVVFGALVQCLLSLLETQHRDLSFHQRGKRQMESVPALTRHNLMHVVPKMTVQVLSLMTRAAPTTAATYYSHYCNCYRYHYYILLLPLPATLLQL